MALAAGARTATRLRMSITRFTTTPLSTAFDDLQHELVRLDRGWTCNRERASLRYTAADIRHHVCAALAWLDDIPPDVARYDRLDGEARILAHEAFLSVLALGQLLLRAIADKLANEVAIARAQCAVEHMLDVLAPLVSRADDALRRVLLEEVSIETALDGIGHGQ
jgi:hypothetical protein